MLRKGRDRNGAVLMGSPGSGATGVDLVRQDITTHANFVGQSVTFHPLEVRVNLGIRFSFSEFDCGSAHLSRFFSASFWHRRTAPKWAKNPFSDSSLFGLVLRYLEDQPAGIVGGGMSSGLDMGGWGDAP